jgi:hypothetical protein
MLEARIALFPWFLGFAVVIKALNSKPCSVSTGLPSLGVEVMSKGILMSKDGTILLQVILGRVVIHPETETLIANELADANSFINRRVLCLRAI